jgi:hypothetical protein
MPPFGYESNKVLIELPREVYLSDAFRMPTFLEDRHVSSSACDVWAGTDPGADNRLRRVDVARRGLARKYGAPAPTGLPLEQQSFYRAGHAHAGVLTILGVVLQILLDHSALPPLLMWWARAGALLAPLLVSAGFFGVAHVPALRGLLYLGAATVIVTTLMVGIGLVRRQ